MDLTIGLKWAQIPSTLYEVSDAGHIKSPSGRILNPFPADKSGHLAVDLPIGRRYVHRLVAESFMESPTTDLEVRHLNNNPTDNRVQNLEWGTRSQNVLDLRQVRTHCPHGHEYTEANTRVQPNGWRRCRQCKRRYH